MRCACDIRDTVHDLGLEVRAGPHTGEVERRRNSIAGLAVHIGARVASLAAASEVLVTSVVRALVLGSGIAFADRASILSRECPTPGSCSQRSDRAVRHRPPGQSALAAICGCFVSIAARVGARHPPGLTPGSGG